MTLGECCRTVLLHHTLGKMPVLAPYRPEQILHSLGVQVIPKCP